MVEIALGRCAPPAGPVFRRPGDNGAGCCGKPAKAGIDDVGFITAAVADIEHNVSISASHVYATGMSNGGMMDYTLACDTTLFAAIGPVSGTQLDPCRSPHPVSVMHIHGTKDPLIPYGGGPGGGFVHLDGPPIQDTNAFWRNVDRCSAPAVTARGSVTTSTAGCADNSSVVRSAPEALNSLRPITRKRVVLSCRSSISFASSLSP